MRTWKYLFGTTLVVVFCLSQTVDAGLRRAEKRLGFFEFRGSYSAPVGTVDGFPIDNGGFFDLDGRIVDVNVTDLYDATGSFGFGFGAITGGHTQLVFGLQYTNHPFVSDPLWILDPPVEFESYDADLDVNFHMFDLQDYPFTPFVGFGLASGITRAHLKGIESEYRLTGNLNLNFGAEMKLFTSSDERSMVTLASVNSYDFAAWGDRPRAWEFGGALRFYVSR